MRASGRSVALPGDAEYQSGMDAFPAFFPLADAVVVIAGSGEAAEAKARLFDGSPATLRRLTGDKALTPAAYEGAVLAFVATEDDSFALAARTGTVIPRSCMATASLSIMGWDDLAV